VSGPRMTVQMQVVLHALLADPDEDLYGLEIAERTGLLPGTTYPILVRLERVGWVRSRWEDIDPHDEQRPRRRYYQLTPNGTVSARDALARTKLGLAHTVQQWGLSGNGAL
jgi:PadR family transcriptional regulator, regulatory protein PadR